MWNTKSIQLGAPDLVKNMFLRVLWVSVVKNIYSNSRNTKNTQLSNSVILHDGIKVCRKGVAKARASL